MRRRKMVLRVGLVLLLLPVALAATGWQAVGPVTAIQPLPHGVELQAGAGRVRVEALSPAVVRVRYAPGGSFAPEDPFAVVTDPGFTAPAARLAESPDAVEFSTGQLTVRVLKSPLRVVFLDAAGEVILQDHPGLPAAWNGAEFRVWKSMPQDEHYFGLGDKAGPINHRDQAFTLWNTDAFGWTEGTDPLYKSIPFFLAMRRGRAYGLFLDNTFRSSFDFGKQSRDYFSFGAEAGPLDYYFFYGPEPKAVLASYSALTGRTPLPPRFALGYQQSRYSYFPQARVLEIARTLRQRRLPSDVIYLDIDYQDGHRPFTVNSKLFPDFEGMVRELGRQGFKVVTIVDLHLKQEPGYRPYDQGLARDYFLKNPDGSPYVGKVWPGDSVFPDFTRSEVREWFGGLYADFVRMGVRGIWNDMNEPAVFRYPEKTMPLDTVHSIEGRRADHREAHNVFGMQNARATYEGLLRLAPDQRPFVLTRAAFAGAQRYAASWTGDNAATWTHYRLTLPTLLSLGLSGYPLVGVDVGGFEGNPSPDLLTRWMQLGAFTPVFRNHSVTGSRDREPWVDGPVHERIRRSYLEERYRLLPYLYTSMEETSRTGVPLMRPMFLEFPTEEPLLTLDRQFMFGPDLLVAPKPDERLGPYEVTFPRGAWYDYWTGRRVEGGAKKTVAAELAVLPVYVRAGAILPLQAAVQHTDEIPRGPLQLRVYPGPDCGGALYTDDGNTFAYTRGEFLRIHFTCDAATDAVGVNISAPEGGYKPWWSVLQVTVFGASRRPREVVVGAARLPDWKFNPAAGTVTFTVPWSQAGMTAAVHY